MRTREHEASVDRLSYGKKLFLTAANKFLLRMLLSGGVNYEYDA